MNKLLVVICQNISVVLNGAGKHSDVIPHCTRAIKVNPQAFKAFYQRSLARHKTQEYDGAMEDIKAAIKIMPQDKNLRAHFEVVKKAKSAADAKKAKAMQGMFGGGMYNEMPDPPKPTENITKLPEFRPENTQTYFDIEIGNEGDAEYQKGRVVFELFDKEVPTTTENFRAICTGEKEDAALHYKNCKFHRVIKGFMMQGGDTTAGNGTGGKSIYGNKFNDEGVWVPHTHRGVLSMANSGPNTNGSQFFINYGPTPHLDGKHTCFGRIIHGEDICAKAEANPTASGDVPISPVKIVDCGELKGDDKMAKDDCDYLSNYN